MIDGGLKQHFSRFKTIIVKPDKIATHFTPIACQMFAGDSYFIWSRIFIERLCIVVVRIVFRYFVSNPFEPSCGLLSYSEYYQSDAWYACLQFLADVFRRGVHLLSKEDGLCDESQNVGRKPKTWMYPKIFWTIFCFVETLKPYDLPLPYRSYCVIYFFLAKISQNRWRRNRFNFTREINVKIHSG